MNFEYYYNRMLDGELCRNNLIYTSLISNDKKTFVQWYHNDSEYHKGQNQVVDPDLMQEKWQREVTHLTGMSLQYPNLVPKILDINLVEQKIYLAIDGVDFWQKSLDHHCSFDDVLPDWQNQMLEIFKAHKSLGYWKYSLHPSSYFIVDEQLKSINYFFTYSADEKITVRNHLSHISEERQLAMKPITDSMGIDWDKPQSLHTMQLLAFESFSNNYTREFIEKAKNVFL